jgi:hypothetical protein
MHAGAVQVPQLGPLVARIPLSERVAEREDALLGARLLLVAPRAADQRVEAEFGDGVEQRHGLVTVAALGRVAQHHAAGCDRILDGAHDQPLAELGDAAIAKGDHLGEVVPGVDVQQREGKPARPERLLGEAQQDDRVLAAGEQQRGLRALSRDFAQDVDGLGLEPVEMASVGGRDGISPHPRPLSR